MKFESLVGVVLTPFMKKLKQTSCRRMQRKAHVMAALFGNSTIKSYIFIRKSLFFRDLSTIPANCYEALKRHNKSGSVKALNNASYLFSLIKPKRFPEPFAVSCDLSIDGGGWTVIQRREDGNENFQRNWADYAKGFGHLNGEFFIGLDRLHALTSSGWPQELYIVLEDFEGVRKYARYEKFRVGNANSSYTLYVEGYSGDAGDNFSLCNGQKFSTFDVDNDRHKDNCAALYKGGWWYAACYTR